MFISSSLLGLFFGGILFVYFNFSFYQIWFEPKKYIKRIRNDAYKIPKWYPLRGFAIDSANAKNIVTIFDKIMSIIFEILLIVWLTLLLIAWLTDK
jgi:hypothetical protein